MNEQFISTQEARELTGYSLQHIRQLTTLGKIAFTKFGASLAIDRESLLTYKAKSDIFLESKGRLRGRSRQ